MTRVYANQKVLNIGRMKMGRNNGENAVFVFGTIFYLGHKIVYDNDKGIFDKNAARELLDTHIKVADKFGLNHGIDVHAATPEAMRRYLEFVYDNTDEGIPVVIDGTTENIRIAGAELANELGETERTIYDSISPDTKEMELQKIKENDIKTAFLLALNPSNLRPEGRVEIIREKLLPMAEKAGIKNIILDTIVFDPPSVGLAAKAIELVKEEFGWPTGNAPPNATEMLEEKWPYTYTQYIGANTGIFSILQAMDADWLFYGKIELAKDVLFTIALIDGILAYINKLSDMKIHIKSDHPLYRAIKSVLS